MQELFSIEGFRLSPQQKRLWLLQQPNENQPYRAHCTVLIEGNLNLQILELALHKIVERYEIFRTSFQALRGMTIPLQVITANPKLALHSHNLSSLTPEAQTRQIELLFREAHQQHFNIEDGAVLEVSLVVLAPDRQVLLIGLPATHADRTTLQNLVGEISRTYAACLQGKELSGEPLQYVDLAEWQNELFEGDDAKLGKEYWQKRQTDRSVLTNWHLNDEKRSPINSRFTPEFFSLPFESSTLEKLAVIARNYDTSTSAVLQTCWQVLLSRLSERENIVVGTYCDGRNYEELESALGLFAKYLPIYCRLENRWQFCDLLKQTDQAIAEVFNWQDSFNWEYLVLEPSFFPVCFEVEEQPASYQAADVSFAISKQYVCVERFKLKLNCVCRHDSLVAEFHYDANVFREEDIARLARHFQTLLKSVIEQPTATIEDLEILSSEDRQQLLVEFNNTQTNAKGSASEETFIHWFERQVERTPDRLAVVFENQQLTYNQLNARANQLAHHLQASGVSPETIVALYVDRSLEMAIALLGILKAGAAYLPLDPLLPSDRLAFMVEDSRADLIVTQQSLGDRLKAAVPVVFLDADWETIARQPKTNLPCQVTAENLVYVIYTSGSTGKPKGVAIEHRQLLNYLDGILEKLDLPEGSSFATVSTLAADLGNTAIFPAWCTGGCLHVISQERATNPEALADYSDRHSIDCLKIVPSHLNALLSAVHPEKLLPKQRLILGGEALSWQLVEKIQQYRPTCQIFNHYGPTEATVGVLTYAVSQLAGRDASQHPNCQTVPLGRPLANTQIYILDQRLRPVPIGVSGELYIGGNSLARGYLNQSALTAERFIDNPFLNSSEFLVLSSELEENSLIQNSVRAGFVVNSYAAITELSAKPAPTNSKLYKTGDLARYLPDGNIEFIGRIDNQVKIRGFRIELEEIELGLKQHPAIRETAVVAREDKPGNVRLVAYLVLDREQEIQTSDLRNFLKEQLPEYMVPSMFVYLKALPLTVNGKIDRQALPAPDSVIPEMEGRFVAPRTPLEEAIANIWAQVLERDRVGIYDNFFELGGDSIVSIQITARANQAGLQLTPKQLLEHQTIAGLATVVGTTETPRSEQGLVTGTVPLTPIQHWFFEQELPDLHHWNQSLLLRAREAIDPTLMERAVQHLLEHHDALRLRFTRSSSGWQQVNAGLDEIEAMPFSRIDLSGLPAAERETAVNATVAELQASLNLIAGQLVRVALFEERDGENRLFIAIHHLAVDGVSWRILLEDLQKAYQQLSSGETVALPPKTTSFKRWSEVLQEYVQSTAFQQERDYWLRSPRESVSRLPADNLGGENTVASARIVSVSLTVEETRALLQEVPAAYRTQIEDVLLTALAQTLTRWMRSHSLLVDLEGHGREAIVRDIDLSRTVGWFTAIYPVLLTLEGIQAPGEAIKAIKEQLRAVPNRGIGYGVLRYLSAEAASLDASLQVAEVRFNYLGQFDRVLSKSSLFELQGPTSKTDRSPRGQRRYAIAINGFVLGGQLQLDWEYSEQIYKRTTIANVAREFIEALRSLIAHCQSPSSGGYTPSDFPKTKVSQTDLEQLLAKIKGGKG